jgi:hypothetical protein
MNITPLKILLAVSVCGVLFAALTVMRLDQVREPVGEYVSTADESDQVNEPLVEHDEYEVYQNNALGLTLTYPRVGVGGEGFTAEEVAVTPPRRLELVFCDPARCYFVPRIYVEDLPDRSVLGISSYYDHPRDPVNRARIIETQSARICGEPAMLVLVAYGSSSEAARRFGHVFGKDKRVFTFVLPMEDVWSPSKSILDSCIIDRE